ncbi:MAG: hypothetical protein WC942_09265 [Clostridia bacterium]|jgi:hypothetical protein
MQFFDLNGKVVKIDIRQSKHPRRNVSKSQLQTKVGEVLDNLYPHDSVLEEFFLPGSRLSVDFFIPSRSLVIEIQGVQHDQHVEFFHGKRETSLKFGKQQQRDRQKAYWCELNGLKFVEIRSEKDIDQLYE